MLVCIYLYMDIRGSVSTIVVRIQNLRDRVLDLWQFRSTHTYRLTYIHPCSTHLLCRHSHLLRLPAHRTTLYSSLLSHDSREQRRAAATVPCSGVTVAVVRGATIAAGLMANRRTQPCSMCVVHLLIY